MNRLCAIRPLDKNLARPLANLFIEGHDQVRVGRHTGPVDVGSPRQQRGSGVVGCGRLQNGKAGFRCLSGDDAGNLSRHTGSSGACFMIRPAGEEVVGGPGFQVCEFINRKRIALLAGYQPIVAFEREGIFTTRPAGTDFQITGITVVDDRLPQQTVDAADVVLPQVGFHQRADFCQVRHVIQAVVVQIQILQIVQLRQRGAHFAAQVVARSTQPLQLIEFHEWRQADDGLLTTGNANIIQTQEFQLLQQLQRFQGAIDINRIEIQDQMFQPGGSVVCPHQIYRSLFVGRSIRLVAIIELFTGEASRCQRTQIGDVVMGQIQRSEVGQEFQTAEVRDIA